VIFFYFGFCDGNLEYWWSFEGYFDGKLVDEDVANRPFKVRIFQMKIVDFGCLLLKTSKYLDQNLASITVTEKNLITF
jgi:hypothetical protein